MGLTDDLDRPAVRQRLVDGEIQTGVSRLHRRSVERTAPVPSLRPPTGRAHVGGSIGPTLHEQELDSTVGRGLQRLLPAGRGSATSCSLLAPAREQLVLPAGSPPPHPPPRP